MFSLFLLTFEDTDSMDFSQRRMVYPLGSTRVTTSRFLEGNREDELEPTTFFSLLHFRDFLSFLFSWPLSDTVPLIVACW